MTFSDNLMAMEQQQQQPWMFRSTFEDSWLSDAFVRDTETLTKAFKNSISNHYSHDFSTDVFNSFSLAKESPTTTTATATTAATTATQLQTQTPTVSGGGGGSESETTAMSKKRKITNNANGEKATKRRSRASKRVTTTYIAADPENFRQMVQQVTGVRFGSGDGDGDGDRRLPIMPAHKPGPQRISNNSIMQQTTSILPTLDTSAFLLDQINNNPRPAMSSDRAFVAQPRSAANYNGSRSVQSQSQPEWVDVDGDSSSPFDFDFFCTTNFPILESNVIV